MKKKNSFVKFIVILVLLLSIGGATFIYLSPQFEQDKPEVTLKSNEYWNLKSELKIDIKDQSGLKNYKVVYFDGTKEIVLEEKIQNSIMELTTLSVAAPKLDAYYKGKTAQIIVTATDNSKWNFLNGNEIVKKIDIKIDIKKPVAKIISNSRYIKRGGSAIVIVKIKDENLKKAYITFNKKQRFRLTPFVKENYYISLIAWDINTKYEDFNRVDLIAIDKANNLTKTKVPLYIQDLKIKKDTIKISEKFINKVSVNVLEKMNQSIPKEYKDIFISQNKHLRASNIAHIKKVTNEHFSSDLVSDFKVKAFKRLKGSRTAAGFAERRSYILNEEKIDEAWHLGMDWASVRNAPIYATNGGKVIYEDYLGIYGDMIIIDHGIGLSSLYAHTSTQHVENGDEVGKNEKIANTGITGAVLGDHLHFGILIQGIEVNPIEWMDKNWIQTRINDIIQKAQNTIKEDN